MRVLNERVDLDLDFRNNLRQDIRSAKAPFSGLHKHNKSLFSIKLDTVTKLNSKSGFGV